MVMWHIQKLCEFVVVRSREESVVQTQGPQEHNEGKGQDLQGLGREEDVDDEDVDAEELDTAEPAHVTVGIHSIERVDRITLVERGEIAMLDEFDGPVGFFEEDPFFVSFSVEDRLKMVSEQPDVGPF
jgi:hypothetical protein